MSVIIKFIMKNYVTKGEPIKRMAIVYHMKSSYQLKEERNKTFTIRSNNMNHTINTWILL